MSRDTLREALRTELDRLLVDAHGVPDAERDQWADRLARAALEAEPSPSRDTLREALVGHSISRDAVRHAPPTSRWVDLSHVEVALEAEPVGLDVRLRTAVIAAIENIQHNRIGAAVAGLRAARDADAAALRDTEGGQG